MNIKFTFIAILLAFSTGVACSQTVDFKEPKDGSTVKSPFKVVFVSTGVEVAPAGEIKENSGHHHLIINGDSIPEGQTIPFDDTHKHFGKGQTETEISLPPGKYKLTMQFANGAHLSYGPKLSKTIHITVE